MEEDSICTTPVDDELLLLLLLPFITSPLEW